jgi:hypothetical protein
LPTPISCGGNYTASGWWRPRCILAAATCCRIALSDAYDAKGNLAHIGQTFFENRPDIPATIYGAGVIYNVQTGQYCVNVGLWNEAPMDQPYLLTPVPPGELQPTAMAASEQF